MSITTVSARDFARGLASAKRAVSNGPVFITDRGKPTLALLKIEDYYRLTGIQQGTLLQAMDAIACPEGIEFETDRNPSLLREVEF